MGGHCLLRIPFVFSYLAILRGYDRYYLVRNLLGWVCYRGVICRRGLPRGRPYETRFELGISLDIRRLRDRIQGLFFTFNNLYFCGHAVSRQWFIGRRLWRGPLRMPSSAGGAVSEKERAARGGPFV